MIHIEYLEDFKDTWEGRQELVHKYSWAVPSHEALDTIEKYSPNGVVEIGAGNGYWAYLLRKMGVKVLAYDSHARKPDSNPFCNNGSAWTNVRRGDPLKARNLSNMTLFLCWPPYSTSMAYDTLKAYQGEYFVYVGEDRWGCNGDDAFFDYLQENFEQVEQCYLKNYSGIRDYMVVYKRKR